VLYIRVKCVLAHLNDVKSGFPNLTLGQDTVIRILQPLISLSFIFSLYLCGSFFKKTEMFYSNSVDMLRRKLGRSE
jgi:hypothetical protein